MYDSHFVTYEEKAKFYNKIYEPLHPCYDPQTRIYHKALKDNDFEFKDNKLHYGKLNDLNFDRANEVYKLIFIIFISVYLCYFSMWKR